VVGGQADHKPHEQHSKIEQHETSP